MTNWDRVAMILLAVIVVGSTASFALEPMSDEVRLYVEGSSAWCEERNGTLVQSNVIGPHGGLHCKLPNGTSIHMDTVPRDDLEAASENMSNND